MLWLCLVGRSGWARLNPQVRKGAKPSTSVLILSCARSSCEHQICAGLWELILSSGGHWDLFSSQPHLWRSVGFVQVFGSQPSPLEVPGLCVCQPSLPFGSHWDLSFQRSQSSVFYSQASPLEVTGIPGLRAGTRLKLVPPKLPWWRRC